MATLLRRISHHYTQFLARSLRGTGKLDLTGVFPAVVTPFDVNERVDFQALRQNLSKWARVPFAGYLVQGSNGEFATMDPEERVEMVSAVKGYMSANQPGKILLAGSGCQSTKQTVELSKEMARAGADALVVVTPSFYKGSLNDRAFLDHYTEVADGSPVPVILYSVPANTGIDLDANVVIRLAQHPNVIGLKDSGGDMAKMGFIADRTRDRGFQVLAGSAGFFLAALSTGCVGGIFALANVLGPSICRLQDLAAEGDWAEARALQARLVVPNWAVTKVFGVSGLKRSMEWFELRGGAPRRPIAPLSDGDTAKLKEIFSQFGFLEH